MRQQARPPSPGAAARQASSAAEIENEMLRDQVQHLQKKLATLEDTLEETRAANERDDAAVHDRLRRYKEREEGIRKELAEGRQEAERLRKAEEQARARVAEVEPGLVVGVLRRDQRRQQGEQPDRRHHRQRRHRGRAAPVLRPERPQRARTLGSSAP